MTQFDEQDEEYDQTVGLDFNDLQVTYRAAFSALWPAVDRRWNDKKNGKPFDAAHWQEASEKFFAEVERSRELLDMGL